jgi:hypothetical protein
MGTRPGLMPVLELQFQCRWLWLSLSSPNFEIQTPHLRPRLTPKISTVDLGELSDFRWMMTLTWFFHLTVAYGRPAPRSEDAQPVQ